MRNCEGLRILVSSWENPCVAFKVARFTTSSTNLMTPVVSSYPSTPGFRILSVERPVEVIMVP